MLIIFSAVPVAGAEFTGNDKIVIAIDPGHGGANVGTAKDGIGEKMMTYQLGLLLKEKLEANGNFVVHMTRTGDYDLPLASRGIYANTVNADLLVSLHFDGSTSKSDRGISVITSVLPEYEMTELAGMVCNNLSAKTGLPIKGIIQRKDNAGYYWNAEKQWDCKDSSLGSLSDYYGIPTWCSKFGIGSILIEHGFFTNDSDAAIIFSDGMLEQMAEADAQAIIDYYTNHSHAYSETATRDFPSNCMFQGKQSQKCTVCGHRKNITNLEAAPDNHYWINEKTKSPTCGTNGYTSRQCWITINLNEKDVVCENHEEVTYVTAQPHNYELTETKEVTHSVDGYYQYTCTNCGNSYKETVKAEGHAWKITEQIEPNCEQLGKINYHCDACNESYSETIASLGHSLTVTDRKSPTCTEDGYINSHCTACGEDIEEVVSASGHALMVEILSESSCTVNGETHSVCSVCGFEEIAVDPQKGHDMVLTKKTDATCEKDGYILYTCSVCGYEEKQDTLAVGHSFSTEITAEASMFTRGVKLTTCVSCGENYSEVIPSTWDTPAAKAIMIGGPALIAAVIFTVILFYMKRKNKNANIAKTAPAEFEMAEAAEAIIEQTESESTDTREESTEEIYGEVTDEIKEKQIAVEATAE